MGFGDFLAAAAPVAGYAMGGPVGGAIGGMVGSAIGQSSANDANKDIAASTNAASMAIAQQQTAASENMAKTQMAFQERMSNTALQRQMKDAKKAGINPIFLAGGGGSSSPAGASGSAPMPSLSTPQMQNVAGGVGASAFQLATLGQQLEKGKAEIGLIDAQKKKTGIDAAVQANELEEGKTKNNFFGWLNGMIRKGSDVSSQVQGAVRGNRQDLQKIFPEIKVKPQP